MKYPRALLRTVFIIINNCYCIPTYVMWMVLLLPVKRIQPDIYYRVEGIIFHWLLAMVSCWSWSAGYDSKLHIYSWKFVYYYFFSLIFLNHFYFTTRHEQYYHFSSPPTDFLPLLYFF